MGREVGRRFTREGTWVYLWLIPADVWQKPTQYCKAINLQLKIDKFIKISYTPIFLKGTKKKYDIIYFYPKLKNNPSGLCLHI